MSFTLTSTQSLKVLRDEAEKSYQRAYIALLTISIADAPKDQIDLAKSDVKQKLGYYQSLDKKLKEQIAADMAASKLNQGLEEIFK